MKHDEKQLLADARYWFEEKYEKSPEEFGMQFMTIWNKPILPMKKIATVVFAPSEKAGRAFIREQNVILWALNYFFVIVMVLLLTFFIALYASKDFSLSASVLAIVSLCLGLLILWLAKKCKKLEEIHKWNIEIYYVH